MTTRNDCRSRGMETDVPHGTGEGCTKIEPDPPIAQVVWFGNRPAAENWARIADRRRIVSPVRGQFLDFRNHSVGREYRPGQK